MHIDMGKALYLQRSNHTKQTQTRNRDSIKSKIFGDGGMGTGEEETFYRKFLPPFPVPKTSSPQDTPAPENSVAGEAEHDGTDTAFDHDAEESAHQRAFGGLTGFVVVAPPCSAP